MEKPIEDKYYEVMNKVGGTIDSILNDGKKGNDREHGFALLVFPFKNSSDPRMNYISNAIREDMLVAMKEFIARAEGTYKESRSVH